ncbi:hypothetical protein E4T56_gene12043 [Termitomyces sp. T112]|nr:hypothetical protein E4T56_gene12043 [Termitomyces sp. T112]
MGHHAFRASPASQLPETVIFQFLLDEFLDIPPGTTDENECKGAWNVLLSKSIELSNLRLDYPKNIKLWYPPQEYTRDVRRDRITFSFSHW